MIQFVDQTIFEFGKGNCLAACVASVLNLPLSEVPNFAECGYMDGLRNWLKDRNMRMLSVWFSDPEHCASAYFGDTQGELLIMCGESPRSTEGKRIQHAVVGSPNGYGCKLIHDPHPSRDGLRGYPQRVLWIVPALASGR